MIVVSRLPCQVLNLPGRYRLYPSHQAIQWIFLQLHQPVKVVGHYDEGVTVNIAGLVLMGKDSNETAGCVNIREDWRAVLSDSS